LVTFDDTGWIMSGQADFEELQDDVLVNRDKYAALARQGFKDRGRGVVIPATARLNLGGVGGDTYWPLAGVYAVSFRLVVRELVEIYNPTTEFVVMIATQDGQSGLLKLNLEGIANEGTHPH
jgi:hypothetical protein